MNGVLTNALIAVGAAGVIGYALISHFQSRGVPPRTPGQAAMVALIAVGRRPTTASR
jgi:hypothetical protein